MAIVKARVAIVGIRPLLWHRFGPDALPLEKRRRTGVAGNDPTEWRKTVLVTKDGQLYLEPSYVFGCLRDAAKYTQRRRGTLQPILAATLQVKEERILMNRRLPKSGLENLIQAESEPVFLDVRSVRNPSTGARNVRYRVAASPGWKASFTPIWDNTVVDENQLQAVLRDAGQLVGIGDGRSIGFGRFQVSSFEMEKPRAEKKAAKGNLGKNAPANLGTGR